MCGNAGLEKPHVPSSDKSVPGLGLGRQPPQSRASDSQAMSPHPAAQLLIHVSMVVQGNETHLDILPAHHSRLL